MRLSGKRLLTALLSLLFFLVNLSGCSLVVKTQYELLSDQNRCVTMVSASRRYLIGIVLDEKNLLLSDYTGKTIAERAFDQRIISMDVHGHEILLGFEDNHIEVYQESDGQLEAIYSQEFEDAIVKCELPPQHDDSYHSVILLANGMLFDCFLDNAGLMCGLINKDVVSFSCEESSCMILYLTADQKIICWATHVGCTSSGICEEDLGNIESVETYHLDGRPCFLARGTNTNYLIDYDAKDDKIVLMDTIAEESIVDYSIAKVVPESVVYREQNSVYYEGPSYNQRRYYGEGYDKRRSLNISDDYQLMAILGGVIYYNDHEVNVYLIK